MAKASKAAASKQKSVAGGTTGAKTALRARAEKRSSSKSRSSSGARTKQQKLKLKVHRPKQPATKATSTAASKAKGKTLLKRVAVKAPTKPHVKAANKKEQR